MPVRSDHDPRDRDNVVVRDGIMKKVAHGINEVHLRHPPSERFAKLLRNKAQVESELVWMSLHSAEPFGEGFRVTVFTAWANLCAAPDRVPSCIGPFDCGCFCHHRLRFFEYRKNIWRAIFSAVWFCDAKYR